MAKSVSQLVRRRVIPSGKRVQNALKYRAIRQKNLRGAKMANVYGNIYYFKRKVAPGTLVNLTTKPSGALTFSLDQLPGSGDFTALFDQYMIKGVKVDFRLILDPAAQPFGSAIYPNLYVRRDYDNTDTETVSEIAQDNKSKRFILQPNKAVSVYVKPAVQAEYFNQGTALTLKSPQWNKYIDCVSPNYQHLGLKWSIDTLSIPMTAGVTMTIEYTYYLKMKNTR